MLNRAVLSWIWPFFGRGHLFLFWSVLGKPPTETSTFLVLWKGRGTSPGSSLHAQLPVTVHNRGQAPRVVPSWIPALSAAPAQFPISFKTAAFIFLHSVTNPRTRWSALFYLLPRGSYFQTALTPFLTSPFLPSMWLLANGGEMGKYTDSGHLLPILLSILALPLHPK